MRRRLSAKIYSMERKQKIKIPVYIAPSAYLNFSLLCLLMPIQWVAAFVFSTMIHEVCHLIALRLCRVHVLSAGIQNFGMRINTAPISLRREMICAMAGPAGSAALLLLAKWMPLTALCGLFHLLYNLLPIYPADGGRILRCGLKLFAGEQTAEKIGRVIQGAVLCLIGISGIYVSLRWQLGLLPLVAVALVLYRAKDK